MSTRTTVTFVTLALLATGCAKKVPQPMAPAVAAARPAASEPTRAAAPADVAPRRDETPDIWSQDVATIDAWAKSQGLLGEVYFDYDHYELLPAARERLSRNAEFLKKYPDVLVLIEGHCDERGTAEYNIALGDRRASSTVHFLEQLGISRDRMRTVSYGEERPQCREANENCWSKNRRAAFSISGRRASGSTSTGG